MPKLRHVALNTPDPEATAEFYMRVFDMVEVGRAASGIYLSDGTMNLAVLKLSPEMADRQDGMGAVMGLHHVGFWVEDVDEARRRLRDAGAEVTHAAEVTATSFYEEKWKGPEGAMIDITAHGWVGAQPPAEMATARRS